MKDIKYIIANNVRLYRKKANLTQLQLAEEAELSLDSIKRIELGSRSMSLENFMRIAEALHIPLSYLLYEDTTDIGMKERLWSIIEARNQKQREYLLHMLEELAKGMDKLLR